MTIRYECPECDSVLKIKDEKAGKPGRCPKCRTKFTVPVPGELATVGAGAGSALAEEFEEDPIDMPLRVTPDVELSSENASGSDFDPMAVLDGTPMPPTKSAADDGTPRPSVAELMKEHHAKKKKETATREKRQKKKVSDLLTGVETSGSAADAITRSYEKKRSGDADEPVSREQRRAAEERAAKIRFGIQGGIGLALVLGLVWGITTVMFGGGGLELVEVTGRVTQNGNPVPGLRVQFDPVQEINGPKPPGGGSYGKTNADGEYQLQFDAERLGAIVWNHDVRIENSIGGLVVPPSQSSRREVTADGENRFDFNF